MEKKVFMISGEESGDLHGAAVIAALKKRVPGVEIHGMGGERMRRAGLVGLDSREVSVVGVVEVVEKLPAIWKAFRELKRMLASSSYGAVVLIDFPDFNLRIARAAKRLGIPVIYYISPQVWAWRRGRVKEIARLVDRMLVVFPFEVSIYRKAGVDVEYVGHPLADAVDASMTREEARASFGLNPDWRVVALLPGSRTGEVDRLLGMMLKAGEALEDGLGGHVTFLLPAADSIGDAVLKRHMERTRLDVRVVRSMMYEALRASDAAVVASGTATLETALLETPMVIVYRMSPVSYGIARLLVRVRHIGLPNIVAGKDVVPELIQGAASPANVASALIEILKDGGARDAMIRGLREIKRDLGRGGAAGKAADAIRRMIVRDEAV
jgi:lipid-A-disaccharide synthase